MVLKYCPSCGSELDPDTRFCSSCGADLKERVPQVASEPPKTIISAPPQQTPITIQEPKPVSGVEYGDFVERLIAIIIDGLLIGIIGLILNFILNWVLASLIGYAIALLYFWILETYNNGQTIGKMAMNLRTVNENTLETADAGKYLVNNLLKSNFLLLIVDFLIGILTNSGDSKKRLRIMQNASNTVVIKKQK